MSRISYKYVPKNGTKEAGRDRARIRETGRCPFPLSRPVLTVPCPVSVPESVSKKEEERLRMQADPRFAAWVAGQS